jgi:hypothetical protein
VKRIRESLRSPALVISIVAVFLAAGGTSLASGPIVASTVSRSR